MMQPKLFLATDHAGFEHKNTLRDYLLEHNTHGFQVVDLGAFVLDELDDYPVFIAKAAQKVSANPTQDRAVVFGGSGQGEAIVANKYRGVRATVYYGYDSDIIDLARAHNDTNVLSIGARFVQDKEMVSVVQQWLVTPFSGETRHTRRLGLIARLEERRFWRRFIDVVRNKVTS